ncbi:MAG: toll/interleukin-1 receptor domain-containing protein [Planctomycetes bacterium]|nr:toll/interleukin-1 receptor domain-containing protein [Planctomycetota bacterium]
MGATHKEPRSGYDVFISHASEDKVQFVRPLAEELRRMKWRVWYDEFTLKVGDRLRRSIDKGLLSSRYGIVVLSKAFFAKDWPQYELDGLAALEVNERKVILPIWHGVTKADVLAYSPPLADRVAILSSSSDIAKIAQDLSEVLRS